jgi:hypothetical protein
MVFAISLREALFEEVSFLVFQLPSICERDRIIIEWQAPPILGYVAHWLRQLIFYMDFLIKRHYS